MPKTIPSSGTPLVTSNLTVTSSGEVQDVDVVGLVGTHTYINDLGFKIKSPTPTTKQIMYRVCSNQDNFNLNFDDESANAYGSIPCPPTGGGTYRPQNALSVFDGEERNGTWQLRINDYVNNDGGILQGWGLRICTAPTLPNLADALAHTTYAYDGQAVGAAPTLGNLTTTNAYSATSPAVTYTTTTVYDAWGRPTLVTDANNHAITTTYDADYGYADTVTNALSHTATQVVDPGTGEPLSFTDPNDLTVTYSYDDYGRLIEVVLPTEAGGAYPSYTFDYDIHARPATVKSSQLLNDGGAYLETWSFVDGFGREIQTQGYNAAGDARVLASKQYDGRGKLYLVGASYEVAGSPGSAYVTPVWVNLASYQRYTYDPLGRQIEDETLSQGSVLWSTQAAYDGWVQVSTDANGHDTERTTDAYGQLAQVREFEGINVYTTAYDYDLAGNLTAVTDAASNVTTMSYDLLGRKVAMDDSDMGTWAYTYDPVGNLIAQQDGRGQWLHLEYDALDRLVAKRRDSANGPLVAEYDYDVIYLGQRDGTRAYDSAGVNVTVETAVVSRDTRYRTTEEVWGIAGGGDFRLAYGYDAADHLTSIQYPADDLGNLGEVVLQTYDPLGQLDAVYSQTWGDTYVDSSLYLPGGQLAHRQHGVGANAVERDYAYEPGSLRLTGQTASSAVGLQQLSYTYDDGGNMLTVIDALNAGQVVSYAYDDLNRLIVAQTSAVGVGQFSHSYTYDAIGNLTDYAGVAYTYSATQPHAATARGNDSYAYDANGNMTARTVGGASYTLTYDDENHLTTVTGPSTSATFLYGADGNRVLATVNGATTAYVAGQYEYTAGGASTSYYTGGAMRRAGYGSGNGVFYLLDDQLHSTTAIVDATGTLQTQEYYYPYGANRGGAQSDLTDKRFTGQYHESGLAGTEGLYYYNARWYDPALARFAQADTVVPDPGNPQSLNRYAYVHNNPARYTDPSGHAVPIDVAGYLRVHPRTGNIIVAKIAGSGLRQLIAFAALGRDTADQRLADILERTTSTGQLPNALSFLDSLAGKATRTHFASTGAIRGDAGFAREYGDDYLYGQLWGFKTPETKQTGHFLTAVDMGYHGSWVRSIVGHEQIGDQWGPLAQVISPSKQDLLAFEMALAADAVGATAVRDTNLGYILNPGQDGLGKRRGNSMEDLRLSVRGWRLGNMVSTGQLGTNKDLANWIALNVAGD